MIENLFDSLQLNIYIYCISFESLCSQNVGFNIYPCLFLSLSLCIPSNNNNE